MRSAINKRVQEGLGLTELDSRESGNDVVKKNDFQQKNQKVLLGKLGHRFSSGQVRSGPNCSKTRGMP